MLVASFISLICCLKMLFLEGEIQTELPLSCCFWMISVSICSWLKIVAVSFVLHVSDAVSKQFFISYIKKKSYYKNLNLTLILDVPAIVKTESIILLLQLFSVLSFDTEMLQYTWSSLLSFSKENSGKEQDVFCPWALVKRNAVKEPQTHLKILIEKLESIHLRFSMHTVK